MKIHKFIVDEVVYPKNGENPFFICKCIYCGEDTYCNYLITLTNIPEFMSKCYLGVNGFPNKNNNYNCLSSDIYTQKRLELNEIEYVFYKKYGVYKIDKKIKLIFDECFLI